MSNKQIKYCYEINQTPKDDQHLLDYDDLVEYFQDNMMIDNEKKILDEKYSWIMKFSKVIELGPLINFDRIVHRKGTFTQNQRYTKKKTVNKSLYNRRVMNNEKKRNSKG